MRPRYAGLGRGGFGDDHNSPADVLRFRFCPVDAVGCTVQAFLESAMLDEIADRIDVAVLENVPHAKLQRIKAQPLGDHVRLRFDSPVSKSTTIPGSTGLSITPRSTALSIASLILSISTVPERLSE